MRRLFVLIPLALALAGPATAVPTQAAPSDDDRPSVKTVNRSYGGQVVQRSPEQRLRIRFRGGKGDLVALRSFPDVQDPTCETTVLRDLASGRKVVQLNADLWVLPASARYVVSYRQECFRNDANDAEPEDLRYRTGIFVSKVVTHDLVPGGPSIDLPVERRALHAAVLRLPEGQSIRVEGDRAGDDDGFDRIGVPALTEPRSGPGRIFHACGKASPIVLRAGAAATPVSPNCTAEVRWHSPQAGDEIWFLAVRRPVGATASVVG